MTKIEMQYKADTGMSAKIGFEATAYNRTRDYKVLDIDQDFFQHFDLDEGILEIHQPAYIEWLEEKVEELQKQQLNVIP